jgi:hypothetical protein
MRRTSRGHLGIERPINRTVMLTAGDHTFIDKQQEAQVPELNKDFLGGLGEPLSAWRAPCDTDEDLTKKAAIDPSVETVIDDVEKVED